MMDRGGESHISGKGVLRWDHIRDFLRWAPEGVRLKEMEFPFQTGRLEVCWRDTQHRG